MDAGKPFRAGLIGYGFGGRVFHAPLLAAAGIELAAIASSRSSDIARDFPKASAYASAQALLGDRSLDMVIICTPSPTHGTLAIKALEAGHHVVVDKPFAASVAEADAMIEAAARAGRMLTCFQNRRWDSDFLTIKALLAGGTLGPIHEYRAHFEFYKPDVGDVWQNRVAPAVGIEFDLGTHMIDQAVQLLGVPQWVEGEVQKLRPTSNVNDHMFVRLGYDGLRANLYASYYSADFSSRFVIHGALGSYRKYHMDGQEAQLRGGMRADDPRFGVQEPSGYGSVTTASGTALHRQTWPTCDGGHQHFYRLTREAIQRGGEPPVKAQEARQVLAVIEALMASSSLGQRVAL
jgi:scyllo-inositol 2-dehydrogenase (NADP+)